MTRFVMIAAAVLAGSAGAHAEGPAPEDGAPAAPLLQLNPVQIGDVDAWSQEEGRRFAPDDDGNDIVLGGRDGIDAWSRRAGDRGGKSGLSFEFAPSEDDPYSAEALKDADSSELLQRSTSPR